MSFSLYVDEEYAGDVASNSGWLEFVTWAETVAGPRNELTQLVEHGVTQNVGKLRRELAALRSNERNVESTRRALLKALSSGSVAVVTDGTTDVDFDGPTPRRMATDDSATVTVAIDFDGTIVERSEFDPDKVEAEPVPDAQQVLHELVDMGVRIIVFTVRGNTDVVTDYMSERDLPYDFVNENPDQPPDSSGKVAAHRYWDDRATNWSGLTDALAELKEAIESGEVP